MRITLDVPDDVAQLAHEIAEEVGESRERILSDALRWHFAADAPALRAEFAQWELASEIDAAKLGL